MMTNETTAQVADSAFAGLNWDEDGSSWGAAISGEMFKHARGTVERAQWELLFWAHSLVFNFKVAKSHDTEAITDAAGYLMLSYMVEELSELGALRGKGHKYLPNS